MSLTSTIITPIFFCSWSAIQKKLGLVTLDACLIELFVKSHKTPWSTICSLQQLLLTSFCLLQISHYSSSVVPKVTSISVCPHPTCCKSPSSALSGERCSLCVTWSKMATRIFCFCSKPIFEFIYSKFFIYFSICVRKIIEEKY